MPHISRVQRVAVDEEPIEYLLSVPYTVYIHSIHWHHLRERIFDERGEQCEFPLCQLRVVVTINVQYQGVGIRSATGEWRTSQSKSAQPFSYIKQEDIGPEFTLHHLTYERLGQERDSDLMILCAACHSLVHARDWRSVRYWARLLAQQNQVEVEQVLVLASSYRPLHPAEWDGFGEETGVESDVSEAVSG